MPKLKNDTGATHYTVLIDGATRSGTARELLESIRSAAASEKLQALDTEEYAELLIKDAEYFVPEAALKFLEKQGFDSDCDRALQYLAVMPSSGVRILVTSKVVA
jgi:hypothetical protein